MAKLSGSQRSAYMAWCFSTGTVPSAVALQAYERHLAGDPSEGPKVRKAVERKQVAIFLYNGDGEQVARVNAANTSTAREEAAFKAGSAIKGLSKIVMCSEGGDGILAVLPDGSVGRVFPIASTMDLDSGETTEEAPEELEESLAAE